MVDDRLPLDYAVLLRCPQEYGQFDSDLPPSGLSGHMDAQPTAFGTPTVQVTTRVANATG